MKRLLARAAFDGTTTTNTSGAYLFPILAAGEYTLEAEASGFKLQKRTGVKIDENLSETILAADEHR